MTYLPPAGALNLPLGVLPRRVSAVEPNVLEQLADLRVEIVALRNLVEVGLDLLATGVDVGEIARFLTSQGRFNPASGCRCSLHRVA